MSNFTDAATILSQLQMQMAGSGNFGEQFARSFTGRPTKAQREAIEQQNLAGGLGGLMDMGVDIRQMPGVAQAAAENPGEVLTSIRSRLEAGDTSIPRTQAFLQAQEAAQAQALAEQEQVMRQEMQQLAPVRALGSSVSNINDMITLIGEEGRLLTPGRARGAYRSMRGFMLNDLRRAFDAGALQQAELDFFKSMIPDAEEWMNFNNSEKMQQLQELKYQMGVLLDDEIANTGRGLNRDDFIRQGRSINDILTAPLPTGFQEFNPQSPTGTPIQDQVSDFAEQQGFLQPGQSIF